MPKGYRMKYLMLVAIPLFFIACAEKVVIKEVLIPTKCEISERIKPQAKDYNDFTEFQTHLRAYYKFIENDLEFCRTGKKTTK